MTEYNCSYCKHWVEALRLKTNSRICKVTKKNIYSDKKVKCIYFDPEFFFCEQNECRMSICVCLNRRRNIPKFENWNKCKKCRQFENEMKGFVVEYWIEGKSTLTKKFEKKIKRREKHGIIKRKDETKRKIKRRGKQRKIKRR